MAKKKEKAAVKAEKDTEVKGQEVTQQSLEEKLNDLIEKGKKKGTVSLKELTMEHG